MSVDILHGAGSSDCPCPGKREPFVLDLLLEVAPYFRLDQDTATELISDVERTVSQWRTVAKHTGLSTSEMDSMELAFEHDAAKDARTLTRT